MQVRTADPPVDGVASKVGCKDESPKVGRTDSEPAQKACTPLVGSNVVCQRVLMARQGGANKLSDVF